MSKFEKHAKCMGGRGVWINRSGGFATGKNEAASGRGAENCASESTKHAHHGDSLGASCLVRQRKSGLNLAD